MYIMNINDVHNLFFHLLLHSSFISFVRIFFKGVLFGVIYLYSCSFHADKYWTSAAAVYVLYRILMCEYRCGHWMWRCGLAGDGSVLAMGRGCVLTCSQPLKPIVLCDNLVCSRHFMPGCVQWRCQRLVLFHVGFDLTLGQHNQPLLSWLHVWIVLSIHFKHA